MPRPGAFFIPPSGPGYYSALDLLRGQRITTSSAEVPEGMAEGVDEHGALLVRDAELHSLVSGEVSVRLQGAAC